MKVTPLAALLLALGAAAGAQEAEAPRLRGSIGFGLGTQYALTGLRGELGYGEWSGVVAIPVSVFRKEFLPLDGLLGTLGARWSPRRGSGPFVGVHAMLSVEDGRRPDFPQQTVVVLVANGGFRWRLGPAWLEVAAGPAVSHLDFRFPQRDYKENNGKLVRRWAFGILRDVNDSSAFPFDLALGLGLQF